MSDPSPSHPQSLDYSVRTAVPREPIDVADCSQRSGKDHMHIINTLSTAKPEAVRFDPVREICRNRCFDLNEQYACVFTYGEYACTNFIRNARKMEAIQLADKITSSTVKDIIWADLWKFVTNVHCVHHFDEAVNFELPYSMEILMALERQEAMQEEMTRKCKEWEAELRRGEEKENARRYAHGSRLKA